MSMSEDLQLLKQLGLSLVLRNGQWYCGQFAATSRAMKAI
jgi:hypothetical protein